MVLPTQENPLFEDDNVIENRGSNRYFENSADADKFTFRTDSGDEMNLSYNRKNINTGSERSKQKSDGSLVDIINNEKELDKINNPWLKESYNLAKKFYEADSKLETQDRAELSAIYSSITKSHILGMELVMISVLTVPYLITYRKYGGGGWQAFKHGGTNPKGRIALLNLNRKFPKIFVFSLFGMIVGGNAGGRIRYNIASGRLENEMVSNERKYNQYQILQMTSPIEAFKWSHYFKLTSIDSSRCLRDPSELLGGVVDYHKQSNATGSQSPASCVENGEKTFKGGTWQKNPFHHIDVEKSEGEQFERTGIQTKNGIPISPYSKKYSEKNNQDDEIIQSINSIPTAETGDNADLDDPFFKNQKSEKNKKSWW
ncbi:hypothetical protein QEN19_003058 [Hanseniaspora menglaensis]